MRSLSNPAAIPETADLPRHVADLFQQIDIALRELGDVYGKLHTAPIRPRDGNVVYADGTNFDPSSLGLGEGFYFYALAQWFPMFNVGPRHITTFTANGSYSKPDWLRAAIVLCKGGGGGGGEATASTKSGGGGGEGAISIQQYLASALAASVTVTVGAGGAAETAGGDTSFGTHTAVGGGGAADDKSGTGSTMGANAAWVFPGCRGGNGMYGITQNGGIGGGSGGGIGGVIGVSAPSNGVANSGGGGGGGDVDVATVRSPGTGGSGFCIVFEF